MFNFCQGVIFWANSEMVYFCQGFSVVFYGDGDWLVSPRKIYTSEPKFVFVNFWNFKGFGNSVNNFGAMGLVWCNLKVINMTANHSNQVTWLMDIKECIVLIHFLKFHVSQYFLDFQVEFSTWVIKSIHGFVQFPNNVIVHWNMGWTLIMIDTGIH